MHTQKTSPPNLRLVQISTESGRHAKQRILRMRRATHDLGTWMSHGQGQMLRCAAARQRIEMSTRFCMYLRRSCLCRRPKSSGTPFWQGGGRSEGSWNSYPVEWGKGDAGGRVGAGRRRREEDSRAPHTLSPLLADENLHHVLVSR